jgi:hypothetical protein
MRVIDSMVMPGGWHYEQPLESGQRQRIEGRTYSELVQRTLLFRLQHIELVPTGTAIQQQVESDMMMWICSHYPTACTGTRGELPKPTVQPQLYTNPINRVEEWFKRLSGQQLEWIDAATAAKRAKTCIACHMNQNWQTNCGACNTNIRTRSLLLRGSHKTGFEDQLRSCLAYGWLLEVAVWLKDGRPIARRKAPPTCWQRKAEEALHDSSVPA